tara:strand:- start:96008 stop:96142 length:135 start_codon:yes stop_codon:yes gene_type:complete
VLILSYQKEEKRKKKEKNPFFAVSYMIMKNKSGEKTARNMVICP